MRILSLCLLLLFGAELAFSEVNSVAFIENASLSNNFISTPNLSKKEIRKQLRKEVKAYRRSPKRDRAEGVLVSLIILALLALLLKWASRLLGGMLTYGQAFLWVLGIAGVILLALLIFIIVIFKQGFEMC